NTDNLSFNRDKEIHPYFFSNKINQGFRYYWRNLSLLKGMKCMLTIENLTKAYGEKLLFEDINVTMTSENRIGLIGVNGTGKSTLLKVIAGIETVDAGEIQHPKEYRI